MPDNKPKAPVTIHEHIEYYTQQMEKVEASLKELAEKNDYLQRAKIELNGAISGLKSVVNAALADKPAAEPAQGD